MRKYLTSIAFLVFFVTYASLHYLDGTDLSAGAPAASSSPTAVSQLTTVADPSRPVLPSKEGDMTPSSSGGGASRPEQSSPAPAPSSPVSYAYADGTYTGSPENAFYGIVQVRATVSGGQIAAVQFVQYPNDRSTSRFINQQAMPILSKEAIRAQDANVDGVSGASDTSMAFRQSLATALSQARRPS